jgi:excisionase family DNA binding protein
MFNLRKFLYYKKYTTNYAFVTDCVMPELMTTRELAAYLRIKERKIYELARDGKIPCARVTGKLLFPKHQIDLWLARETEGPVRAPRTPPPPIIAGSHDSLLDWALRESGSDLAMLTCGSMAGLERLAERRALAAGLHLVDAATGDYNLAAISSALAGHDVVLIEWAWRRQGLVLASGNPHGIAGLADLAGGGLRVVQRQDGSGSQLLFRKLLDDAGIALDDVKLADELPKSELDLGLSVLEGRADCGLAIEAVARQLSLDFIPLARERYDLAVARPDYFEPPFQQLLAFATGDDFRRHAADAGGYDTDNLGRVVWNAA